MLYRQNYTIAYAALLLILLAFFDGSYSQDIQNGTLTLKDLPRMVETYRKNTVRFERDYVGKPFSDNVRVDSVDRNMFSKGYIVRIEDVASKIYCYIDDISPASTDQILSINAGDIIRVDGVVKQYLMVLVLQPCSFK